MRLTDEEIKYALTEAQPDGFSWGVVVESEMTKYHVVLDAQLAKLQEGNLGEEVATEVGLSFQRELIKQSEIPFTGATYKLREDIEAIDPKAWESICYGVAAPILPLITARIEQAEKQVEESTLKRVGDYLESKGQFDFKAWKELLESLKQGNLSRKGG